MTALVDTLSGVLLVLGCVVALTSAVGMWRMPDFFSRIHAAGKTDTLAQGLILLALIIEAAYHHDESLQAGLKLVLIGVFMFISTPSSTHAIARAAHLEGLQPWVKKEEDGPAAEDAP